MSLISKIVYFLGLVDTALKIVVRSKYENCVSFSRPYTYAFLAQPVFALAGIDLALAPAPGEIENTNQPREALPEEPGRGDINSEETAVQERIALTPVHSEDLPLISPFFAGISTILTLGTG